MRMKRASRNIATLVMILLLVLAGACAPTPKEITPLPTLTPEEIAPPPTAPREEITPAPSPMPEANFTLLISDEVNAIGDFEHLWISISTVGVQKAGESGGWTFPSATKPLDLVTLQEEKAQEIWSGNLTAGRYTKVFIYVSDIDGVLTSDNSTDINVKLPSEKLHINTHFTIPDDAPVSFVFDLTVVAAGNERSGIEYILKPVVSQSGPNQKFIKVSPPVTGEATTPPAITLTGEDTTAPVITLTGVTEGQVIVSPDTVSPEFTVSDDTDPEPTVAATLNGLPFISGTEVSEIGEYELVVTAVDASGNEAELTVNFEIVEVEDTTPPEINVTGVADGEQYSELVTPVITVSDDTDPGPTVAATLNGLPFISGTEVSEIGEYELVVTAVDASGNEAELTVNFEIVAE